MTPSTSLTLGGFIQGLQADMMGLIGTVIFILVALWIARALIAKAKANGMSAEDAQSSRGFANKGAGIIVLVALAGFMIHAATYATNIIPRTGLDRSSINQDMNANIKR